MFGSVGVFLFILSIGGFMTVVFATGALDLGIHHLSYRFRERGGLLIAVLMVLFGALGSIKGWSDETLGLYGMMIPLMIALGYDRMVTVAVVHSRSVRWRACFDDQSFRNRHRIFEGRGEPRRRYGAAPRAACANHSGDDWLHALVCRASKDWIRRSR